MNNLCRLPMLLEKTNSRGVTADNSSALDAIEQASRAFLEAVPRIFHTEIGTALFNGNGRRELWLQDSATEPNRGDLISITSITEDGVALVAGTDYYVYPATVTPIRMLERLGTIWSLGSAPGWPGRARNVSITGKWGYSETWDAVVVSGTAVTGSLSDAADLTITASVDVSTVIYAGDTLLIESEQVTVSAVSTTTITVVRGINGTTAVGHTTKALSLRRFPPDIERAVAEDAARHAWGASSQYPEGLGFSERWPSINEARLNYSITAAV